MHEPVTVPGSGHHFPGDLVRLPARHCDSNLGECTSLSAQHGIVSVDVQRWRLAQTDCACEVGRIPTDHGAEIDHHRLTFLNTAIARVVMWAGTVRPGGDDDPETGTIRAELVHGGLDLPRQRFLG